MRITILGTGQVATVLGKRLRESGNQVVQVYGRNADRAEALALLLRATAVTDLDKLDRSADLYLLAVSDSALEELASRLELGQKIIAHTAGAVPMNLLASTSKNYGVFYPLQSIRKETGDHSKIPFLIDGNTAETKTILYDLARNLSDSVYPAGDDLRSRLHLAAVILNNFSNFLSSLARDYCEGEKADFEWLLPLVDESARRLHFLDPRQLQTGPARRHDHATLEKHREQLASYPELQEVYAFLSEKIMNYYPRG